MLATLLKKGIRLSHHWHWNRIQLSFQLPAVGWGQERPSLLPQASGCPRLTLFKSRFQKSVEDQCDVLRWKGSSISSCTDLYCDIWLEKLGRDKIAKKRVTERLNSHKCYFCLSTSWDIRDAHKRASITFSWPSLQLFLHIHFHLYPASFPHEYSWVKNEKWKEQVELAWLDTRISMQKLLQRKAKIITGLEMVPCKRRLIGLVLWRARKGYDRTLQKAAMTSHQVKDAILCPT